MLSQDEFQRLLRNENPLAELLGRLERSLGAVCVKLELLGRRLAPLNTVPVMLARAADGTRSAPTALAAFVRQPAEATPVGRLLERAAAAPGANRPAPRRREAARDRRAAHDALRDVRGQLTREEDTDRRRGDAAPDAAPTGRRVLSEDALKRRRRPASLQAGFQAPTAARPPGLRDALEELLRTFTAAGPPSPAQRTFHQVRRTAMPGIVVDRRRLFGRARRSAQALQAMFGHTAGHRVGLNEAPRIAPSRMAARESLGRTAAFGLCPGGEADQARQRRHRQETISLLRRLLEGQEEIKDSVDKPLDLSLGP